MDKSQRMRLHTAFRSRKHLASIAILDRIDGGMEILGIEVGFTSAADGSTHHGHHTTRIAGSTIFKRGDIVGADQQSRKYGEDTQVFLREHGKHLLSAIRDGEIEHPRGIVARQIPRASRGYPRRGIDEGADLNMA